MLKKYTALLLLVAMLSCTSSDEGWETLFNGEDLTGWHVFNDGKNYNGWTVESGVLVFDPELRTEARSSDLVSDQQYTNFELSLDWMISEQGNSGLFWGVVETEEYDHPYQTGPEIQILDDNWEEYITEGGNKTRAGALYGILAPGQVVSRGAGEWNTYLLHIDHNENLGFVKLNGTEIMRFAVHGADWRALVDASHFKDWKGFGASQTGYISLQDHGSKVAFRNIKIRPIQAQ